MPTPKRPTRPPPRILAIVAVVGLLVAGCSGDDDESGQGATTTGSEPTGSIEVRADDADGCDPLDPGRCLLPFPNDFYTVADDDLDTGRRVELPEEAMPTNAKGVAMDPTELNRNDGFSPGSALVTLLPGLDLERTGAAPITDIGASLDPDAPIVLVDAETGERHPYWAELDANATSDDDRLLFIRPAVNLLEGHRYVVGLRKLVDGAGEPLEPSDAFRAYRDRLDTGDSVLERRRPAMEDVFSTLAGAGVERRDLVLAWDLTVASERNLSERLLHMRDDAFADLGDAAPAFTVTNVKDGGGDGDLLRTVSGTFEVPRYLTGGGEPASVLNNGEDADDDPLPDRNGTQVANFVCIVPRTAVGADGRPNPTRLSLMGHGLLGTAIQVEGLAENAVEANTTFCATDWIGMSTEDVPNAVAILNDLSKFRSLADRLQQGILNFLFLGRLMKHADGLASDPAFQAEDGTPLLAPDHLTFVGLSQGGILGGATSAVAQDWDRAFLGVPAMNYSTLLNRSIDFDAYGAILNPAYPDEVERQLGVLLVQMLWDRGENNGYAQHLTADPYPDTEPKDVLLFEAFGDHQVANIATEVMARTIDARVLAPALADGRSPDVEPLWGIEEAEDLPYDGSALVVWDFGTPAPPTANLPPREGEDPHGEGREDPDVVRLVTEYLAPGGRLIDVCGGQPCRTTPEG
jgi:hypothetical protein